MFPVLKTFKAPGPSGRVKTYTKGDKLTHDELRAAGVAIDGVTVGMPYSDRLPAPTDTDAAPAAVTPETNAPK